MNKGRAPPKKLLRPPGMPAMMPQQQAQSLICQLTPPLSKGQSVTCQTHGKTVIDSEVELDGAGGYRCIDNACNKSSVAAASSDAAAAPPAGSLGSLLSTDEKKAQDVQDYFTPTRPATEQTPEIPLAACSTPTRPATEQTPEIPPAARSTPTHPATEQTPEIPAAAGATMHDPANASILQCSDYVVEPDAPTERKRPVQHHKNNQEKPVSEIQRLLALANEHVPVCNAPTTEWTDSSASYNNEITYANDAASSESSNTETVFLHEHVFPHGNEDSKITPSSVCSLCDQRPSTLAYSEELDGPVCFTCHKIMMATKEMCQRSMSATARSRLNDQLDEALNTIRREPLRTPLVELGSMKALSTATEHAL